MISKVGAEYTESQKQGAEPRTEVRGKARRKSAVERLKVRGQAPVSPCCLLPCCFQRRIREVVTQNLREAHALSG